SQSASRTPQNRSGTASPSQQTQPTQSPRQEGGRAPQVNNVWTQRSSSASGANGPRQYTPANGFNADEVKAALGKDATPAPYKPAEVAGGARVSGGSWGAKANQTASGQAFLAQLAKEIAKVEGGG
ncbi:hypothetical protein BAUCODRAFT_73376, partial [Baudoinia panamericana UAMH 10762]